jgi:CubicO group peptidase (beta-lactamase class C family)
MSRRSFSLGAFCALASTAVSGLAHSQAEKQEELNQAQLDSLSKMATDFTAQYSIPGLSIAIARQGEFTYTKAFGFANREKREPVTESSLFRIASLSKPITSTTIFSLIEQQKLSLDAKVFGPGALLGTTYGRPPFNPGVDMITVEHLLTHTCGGWGKNDNDPVFRNSNLDQKEMIAETLRTRPLVYRPGTNFAYSNFGFCVLGRVIEKVTGAHYADYVRDNILKPCGISDMKIARDSGGKHGDGEVRYYDQEGGDPYGMNMGRMDAAGGWLSTPSDMVRFLAHVDGISPGPKLLKPETIVAMTTGSTVHPGYAKGWEVNARGNWWHIGDLPGTSAVPVRTDFGYDWAAFMNTRRMNPDIRMKLDRMMWDMVNSVQG